MCLSFEDLQDLTIGGDWQFFGLQEAYESNRCTDNKLNFFCHVSKLLFFVHLYCHNVIIVICIKTQLYQYQYVL